MKVKRATESFSPILMLARGIASVARVLTIQWWLHWIFPDLCDRNDIPEHETVAATTTRRRATAIDIYVLCWLAFEIVGLVMVSLQLATPTVVVVQVLTISRVIDMLRASINTALLDQTNQRPDNRVASPARLVLLSIINYLELVACFGILYASHLDLLQGSRPSGVFGAIYFSLLTQLTISFGSPIPCEWLRYVAALQGLLGLLFIAVVISRMMGGLGPLVQVENTPIDPPAA